MIEPGGQRADHGNEFQHSAHRAQNQRVRNPHDARERRSTATSVSAARVSWARMKCASIWLRSLSTFSRNSRCGRDWMVESRKSLKERPSFRKKIDSSGHDEEQPGLLGDVGNAQADALRQLRDLVAVADQERLREFGRGAGSSHVLRRVGWRVGRN